MARAGTWPNPDWYADPSRAHAMRWWDGERWTTRVTDGGAPFDDRADPDELDRLHAHGGDLRARWPPWVVAFAVVALLGADAVVPVLVRYVRGAGAPVAIAATASLLYGVLIVAAVAVHHRVQPGVSFLDAFGLRWRWVDVGWGFVASIAARIAAVILVLPIVLLDPDLSRTNVPSPDDVRADLGLLIGVSIVAVIVAPIVEELFFRGLLQRSLEAALPLWLAIGIVSIVFGLAHVDIDAGWANLGVVAATTAGGAVFGMVARATRRLTPSIVAHALFNAVAIGFLWAQR